VANHKSSLPPSGARVASAAAQRGLVSFYLVQKLRVARRRAVFLLCSSLFGVPLAADTLLLEVGNMVCPNCSGSVRTALEALPGVKSARVDLQSRLAIALTDDGLPAAPVLEAAVAAITTAGFPVGNRWALAQDESANRAQLAARLLGSDWPTIPSVVLRYQQAASADAPTLDWYLLVLGRDAAAQWVDHAADSEVPLSLFAGVELPLWPASLADFVAFDGCQLFAADQATLAISGDGRILLLRLL
jgi:copper chaperone CopZ